MNNLLNKLNNLLKQDDFFLDSNQEIAKDKIKTSALNLNDNLLNILLKDQELKDTFFTLKNNFLIFDKAKFLWIINNANFLPNSYTSFKNKIGLVDENTNFLSSKDDVVLSFPYKDAVLLGGQQKNEEKRSEYMLNEVLCKDSIDYLFAPKVLKKHYKFDGNKQINFSWESSDNYIIKGNNLIVLHSLLPRFRGKVKLIFIDPPYNTNNDTFGYNDSFNHSTWLTFMKNRLEIAKQLLSNDGSIYISIDYNEAHYLKVLMDEIFGRENFQREIIWRMGFLSGYKTTVKNYVRNHDTILFYSKNSKEMLFNKLYIENKDFKPIIKDTKNLRKYLQNLEISNEKINSIFNYINYESRGKQYTLEDTWNCNKWDDLDSIAIESSTSRVGETITINNINFKGQKPEKLLKRIIESSTNEGDIVLDFFLGSGTTTAVAHKLKRRYIGIEQMDYIDDTVCERMKKIVLGEDNNGISKSVKWEGGGSFVYFELLEKNSLIVKEIQLATNDNIESLFNKIISSPFCLNYKINMNFINTKEAKKEFSNLHLSEKKKILFDLLDKNLLYVNYSDILDEENSISDEDKLFTQSFYGDL
ncbi:site-specific DNA-methyltransferase [Mycoplasma hyorhinis]|uniref:site-specific DNA-methyltransferase n=2 Tax=Mesomycoplasma hyorhinis TaxID=2100 RepID=UPI00136DDA68|nr:site-specific DNA-methyltransferase [Mesomycoplasma hyorhinis]MXR07579.1 site-specific DNA-methyltransferase [Mesomycoplasma hyorhinis]